MKIAQPNPLKRVNREWLNSELTASPTWCAVDLRDGNQALPLPMDVEAKCRYFKMLRACGFNEIELGYPASSSDDWNFCRKMYLEQTEDESLWMSVLMPARKELIDQTLASLEGCRNALLHLYIATSELHSKFVLGLNYREIVRLVRESILYLRERAAHLADSHFRFEFSPEEFTDSDPDFILELAQMAIDAWNPEPGEKVIVNLPCTVERALPLRYGDMIDDFCRNLPSRDKCIVSIHAHNDMGTAVAEAEMALLAGGQRVEGTLFGNGERAGNLDVVTLAMNLECMGIDTGLDFSHLERLRDEVCALTGMTLSPRHPYAGELAFTAFSGTHQDAINKGLAQLPELVRHFKGWKLPYLHVNPAILGRSYQKCIRINSQSGKGGLAYVLKQEFAILLPPPMLREFEGVVQKEAETGRELTAEGILELLKQTFCSGKNAPIVLKQFWPRPAMDNPKVTNAEVQVEYRGVQKTLFGSGDGPVAAYATALRTMKLPSFLLEEYQEYALGNSVNAESISIVMLSDASGRHFYGLGFDHNIVQGAAAAITSALNRLLDCP